MIVKRIENSIGGWYVGDFENAAYRTKGTELSFKTHKKGEIWDWHYHQHLDEINLIISGSMTIQGQRLYAGDIFILEPMEIADPEFLEDCQIVCLKLPNMTNDKVIVKRDR
jgi:hypothetical protein